MMSRLRANSITLHASASSWKAGCSPKSFCSTPYGCYARREHALSTQLPHPIARRAPVGRAALMHEPPARHLRPNARPNLPDAAPSSESAMGPSTRGAGEPPGHTLRHFCRGGSPNVFETSRTKRLSDFVRTRTQRYATDAYETQQRHAYSKTGRELRCRDYRGQVAQEKDSK